MAKNLVATRKYNRNYLSAPHPAKFSDEILSVIKQELLKQEILPYHKGKILDPFAGTSKIKSIGIGEIYTSEIEPEWAYTGYVADAIADALNLPYQDGTFDVICTSPTYGNRMADSHNAMDGSHRISYTHYMGRKLDKRNSGGMQWGKKYRQFHVLAWLECTRVLKPGGSFILNISDHIRDGKLVPVSGWHLGTLLVLGYSLISKYKIMTRRLKYGKNSDLRVGYEDVYVLRKDIEGEVIDADRYKIKQV